MIRVGVLGAGGWGIALGMVLNENGHEVTLWEFRRDVAALMDQTRENSDVLPGVLIPERIEISSDLSQIVQNKDLILITLPSHVVRDVLQSIASLKGTERAVWVSATKGIENGTLKRMSQVIAECLPSLDSEKIAALSGPSHAEEVAREIPTLIVAASTSVETGLFVQDCFMNPRFRVYTSQDVIGVELGGSLKNVIALAAGINSGVGNGDNTNAALITRGIVEMTRLGVAMGAEEQTFSGLSGIGDLIVTCMSRHSRNRYVGEQIGKGRSLDDVLAGMNMVAEGVRTARSVHELSRTVGVEMPISNQVFSILFEDKPAREAVNDLMTRDPKAE